VAVVRSRKQPGLRLAMMFVTARAQLEMAQFEMAQFAMALFEMTQFEMSKKTKTKNHQKMQLSIQCFPMTRLSMLYFPMMMMLC